MKNAYIIIAALAFAACAPKAPLGLKDVLGDKFLVGRTLS